MENQTIQIILVVNLICGILMCFAGYTIWRFLCYGLFAVFSIGITLVMSILIAALIMFIFEGPRKDPNISWAIVIIVEIIELLLLAWIIYIIENRRKASGGKSFFSGIIPFGTFFIAGFLGFFDSFCFISSLGAENKISIVFGIICGLFIGIMMVVTGRSGIIVVSSLMGGLASSGSLYFLLGIPDSQALIFTGGGVVIGCIGMAVQFASTKRHDAQSTGSTTSMPVEYLSNSTQEQPEAQDKGMRQEARFCIHCGTKLPLSSSFCPGCGKAV